MLEEAAALGQLVVSALGTIRLKRDNRKVLAQALGALYQEMSALITNADKILRTLRRHNRGKTADLDALRQLLEDQRVILRRINATLGDRKVKAALSIHAPELTPLPVLLDEKRLRIEVLREGVGRARRRFDGLPLEWLRREFAGGPRAVVLPDDRSIDKARRELGKIRARAEELREFIVEHFEVHEVL